MNPARVGTWCARSFLIVMLGHPEVDFSGIQGFTVRSGTPKPIADKLSAAITKAAQSPEFVARAGGMGMNLQYRNAEQYTEFLRAAHARVLRVIKVAGIKTE